MVSKSKRNKPSKVKINVWKCGNPDYDSTEPTLDPKKHPAIDSWNNLSAPLIYKDEARCNAWAKEVENLLLFAGLFSAVVTSFVVEAYKGLADDSEAAILARIADKLGASPDGLPPIPQSSILRLNIFLFISLIIGLSTALIGIICLQWLREHSRANNSLTPDTSFAMLHMRSEALEKWYVPEILASLPVLLQLAVLLFFAGVFELLLHTGHLEVIIPTGIIMGITILFLLSTTILPTLQVFKLYHTGSLRLGAGIPVPCPYKSPQSNFLRKFVVQFDTIFIVLSSLYSAIYWTVGGLSLTVIRSWSVLPRMNHLFFDYIMKFMGMDPKSVSSKGFNYMKDQIFNIWKRGGWSDVDVAWMSLRDNYFQASCSPESRLYKRRERHKDDGGWFDITQGICDEIGNTSLFKVKAGFKSHNFTEHHCALHHIFEYPSANHLKSSEQQEEAVSRYRYLAKCMGYDDTITLSQFVDHDLPEDIPLLREETSFIILYAIRARLEELETPFVPLSIRLAEIYFRIVGRIFEKDYQMRSNFGGADELPILFHPQELYVMDIYGSEDQPFTWQWAVTLDTYFKALFDISTDTDLETLKRILPIHRFFRNFTYNFWRQLDYEIYQPSVQDRTVEQVLATLQFIEEKLTADNPVSEGFILSVIFYVQFYHQEGVWYTEKGDIEKAINGVIRYLRLQKPLFKTTSETRQLLIQDASREERNREETDCAESDDEKVGLFSDDWIKLVLSYGDPSPDGDGPPCLSTGSINYDVHDIEQVVTTEPCQSSDTSNHGEPRLDDIHIVVQPRSPQNPAASLPENKQGDSGLQK